MSQSHRSAAEPSPRKEDIHLSAEKLEQWEASLQFRRQCDAWERKRHMEEARALDVKRDEEEKELKTAKAFVALAQGAPAAKRSVENVKKWEASLQWRRQLDALEQIRIM